jgi:hypothetical protein
MVSENDPIREAEDSALDELLSQARWADADAGAEARLDEAYLAISARHTSRSFIGAAMVLAATLAIAVGGWWIASLNHPAAPAVAVKPNIIPASQPVVFNTQPQSTPLVRPLNPAERLVLIADRQAAKQQALKAKEKPVVDPLAQLKRLDNASLTRLATATKEPARRRDAISLILQRNDLQSFLYFVLRPSTRDDALAVLHAMPNPPTQELLVELNHQQVDYRLAAAKALGGICDHKIDQTLMRMVRRNDHRREAIAALLSCSDPRAKQMLSIAQAYTSADEIRSVQHDLNKTF